METFGKVKVILNDTHVLISADQELSPNDVIDVFAVIDSEKLIEKGFNEPILVPKGERRVVCEQSKGLYLAEKFRDVRTVTKKITVPSALNKGLAAWALNLQ